ncbi:hypothetical protein [Mariniflexile sp. AS56]|uniref:hypothetical protein n=1 Tax=Mariniflexile sp. AS56 TaxID=3063957 RepID=UPI0026ED8E10|nr:hypothetical protein [Mariniflexile sp. AS56]MDO7170715.1 hypothetical protein [Mariniflexile sp. AS56]
MKKNIAALLIFISFSLKAQTYVNYTSVSGGGSIDSNLNKGDVVEGSTFLFEDWNNRARVYCSDQRILDVENINFDLKTGKFASKISKDSIFIFENVFKIKIQNRNFVTLKKIFYESIYTSSSHDFVLLKQFILKTEPELHKITNTIIGPGKYKIEYKYHIYKNGDMVKLNLNKKHVLEVMGSIKPLVLKHVKNNKLSYTKEGDVIKILQYFDTQLNK